MNVTILVQRSNTKREISFANARTKTEPDFSSEMLEVTGSPVIKVMSDPAKPHNKNTAELTARPHELTCLAIHQMSCEISSALSQQLPNLNRSTQLSNRKQSNETNRQHGAGAKRYPPARRITCRKQLPNRPHTMELPQRVYY